jgi:hypothetical protein
VCSQTVIKGGPGVQAEWQQQGKMCDSLGAVSLGGDGGPSGAIAAQRS